MSELGYGIAPNARQSDALSNQVIEGDNQRAPVILAIQTSQGIQAPLTTMTIKTELALHTTQDRIKCQ